MALNIKLVTMPFAALNRPSIGLTQLKAVTEAAHGEAVAVEICYLNQEFGRLLGQDLYDYITESGIGLTTGIGEWLFREAAFPDEPDNGEEYFRRYGHLFDAGHRRLIDAVALPLRQGLGDVVDELIRKYELDRADVVGLSSLFAQNLASIGLARRLRQLNPDVVIVMGGSNCEGTMGRALLDQFDVLDFVFSGYSLLSFPEFVGTLLAGDEAARHRIDGVFSRRNVTRIAAPAPAPAAEPAGTLPRVAEIGRELDINQAVPVVYDDFFDSLDRLIPELEGPYFVTFETSRGCWWGERSHCTFCGLNDLTLHYRSMKPEIAVDMIQGLIDRYADRSSAKGLVLVGVDDILPKRYVENVLSKIDPPDFVSLFYEVKADLTEDDIKGLAASHTTWVQPGIESFSTATLKLMKKGCTSFSNIRLLSLCKKHGVFPDWNLLIGSPGETLETLETYYEFLPRLFHLPPPSGAHLVRFDRFSPYFNDPDSFGIKLRPAEFYEFVYPLPRETLMNIIYHFDNAEVDTEYYRSIVSAMPKLRFLVDKWRALWHTGSGNPPRLRLVEDNGRTVVEDTRRGGLLRIPIGPEELSVLDDAARETSEERLRDRYGATIDQLVRKGLLFRERGRIISLVERSDTALSQLHVGPDMSAARVLEPVQ
ncbi:MAG TPA: RiPP maturation radical SAM C-methyltransferase [Allosphingosinicella sp.]